MYFSAENLPGVNPVVINYKIRHIKNRSAKYSLAWPYRVSVISGGRKTEKSGHTRLHARVAMEESLLSVLVSQSIDQSRSVNE